MVLQSHSIKTILGLLLLSAVACASPRALPDGEARSFYKQDGVIETFYEQVTLANAEDMQGFLSDEKVLSDWPNWKTWEPEVEILPSDDLWYFNTDPESWQNLAGRTGFCIFRNDEVIAWYVTLMN